MGVVTGSELSRIARPRGLREAATIPIQEEKQPSGTMCLKECVGNGAGVYRPEIGWCSLKSVE